MKFLLWVMFWAVVYGTVIVILDLDPPILVSMVLGAISGLLSPYEMFERR